MNQIGVSVIIAHFAPISNTNKYINLLKTTIESIYTQEVDFPFEIIVCDDGSIWSKNLVKENWINYYNEEEIKESTALNTLKINQYLMLPDINKYRGITLKHEAIKKAKYEKIIILDDDHPLIRKNSLQKFHYYLDKYKYVRGRVIGPDGKPQLFSSPNAQGTTYAFTKKFYFEIGGFSEFLFENGFGEDNDFLIRAYKQLSQSNQIEACYAGEIITKDLASNRWKDRSETEITEVDEQKHFEEEYKRMNSFVNDFFTIHGVHPFINNPSRTKKGWVKLPSLESIISEIIYRIKFIIIGPFLMIKRLKSIYLNAKKREKNVFNYLLNKCLKRLHLINE